MFCFADHTDYTCSEYLSKTLERLIEVFLVYLMFTLNRYLPIERKKKIVGSIKIDKIFYENIFIYVFEF